MRRQSAVLPPFVVLCIVSVAAATPIRIPVDQANSSITVELCIAGSCDTDSSHVTGESWIKIAPLSNPATLTLYDFNFSMTESLDFYISWGWLGNFTATGTGLSLSYATPFVPQPPTAVAGGAFLYAGVPADMTGIVSYHATGVPCYALQGAGKLCSDSMNLTDQGTQTGDMNGTISVSPSRVVSLQFNPNFSGPLDPDYPSLGTLSVTGTVRGSVTVPLRGDANLDGSINGLDIQAFLAVLLAPDAFGWQQRFAVDMNDDDAFDDADITVFVDCLLNANCPD